MRRLDRLVPWVVSAFVLTVALVAIYFAAQNIERSGADDAGERLASQVVATPPRAADRVDISSSLAPFYIIYSVDGTPQTGSGYLNGELASVPKGVITTAVANGENRVTWQPAEGLRFATVAIHDGNRVVLAGQSLAPSERRIANLGLLLLIGWLVALAFLAIGAVIHQRSARDFVD